MKDFTAIDFETSNGRRSGVCSIGVVIVRDGNITDKFYSLIQPSPNYYTYWTTGVHGVTRQDTDGQPTFPKVWEQIANSKSHSRTTISGSQPTFRRKLP